MGVNLISNTTIPGNFLFPLFDKHESSSPEVGPGSHVYAALRAFFRTLEAISLSLQRIHSHGLLDSAGFIFSNNLVRCGGSKPKYIYNILVIGSLSLSLINELLPSFTTTPPMNLMKLAIA